MPKVTFNNSNNLFFQSLKNSVEDYFRTRKLKKTGNLRLYAKASILIPLALAFYILLLALKMPVIISIILCAALGFTIATIGFNVMHDACHGSYSSKKWVNNIFGYTLNAMGGNSFFWKTKHNILHHTYTNIEGVDEDIAQSRLLRQSPSQQWLPIHHYQHFYLPLAYALMLFVWVFRDFQKYFTKMVYTTTMQRMNKKEHWIFWISKILYVLFYIIIPVICVGWLPWLAGYLITGAVTGLVTSYVFQLAHAVEGPEFENAGIEDKLIETEWAIHQIRTTANFAPDSKIISWLAGGLNFQVEHHLFPRISHIHYPQISKIVREKCKQFNLPYHSFPTLRKALSSHIKTMKQLGQKAAMA